jgi:hypothetical protein
MKFKQGGATIAETPIPARKTDGPIQTTVDERGRRSRARAAADRGLPSRLEPIDAAAAALQTVTADLKPCPNCGKRAGELKKSEFGSRFPYYVKCNGWATDLVRLPGVAIKLWNDAKPPKAAKAKR